MSTFKTAAAFLLGAAGGSAATWYILKDMYVKQSEEDIGSVKAAFRKQEKKLEEQIKELTMKLGLENVQAPSVLADDKIPDKEDIMEYAGRKYGKYVQYSTSVNSSKNDISEKVPDNNPSYVITPYEFGDLEEYRQISLMYYSDGILADENGVIIDDVEEIVGDALNHFGEYEDDSVYCRNDEKRCDYEVLKDLRRYADVRKNLPSNI